MFDVSFLFGLRRCTELGCTEGARLQGLVVNFAVSHSLTCGSLTLRSCATAWVWVPGCTKPVYKSDTRA